MPLQKVGLDLNGLQNITPPSFSFQNTTDDFINNVPAKANQVTGGNWGVIVLSTLFFWLMWKLRQDEISGGSFGYSTLKSIGISAAVCSVIGLYALSMGYFSNLYHVVIFIIVNFLMVGAVWMSER